jgi:single-stranded DNA-specific DHH superfamily exonuclease
MQFDVFNGDADGICALVQLRLAEPLASTLITGVKRDIGLLSQVHATSGDKITVLDISLQHNRADVQRLLTAGADIFYIDHHNAGEIPEHPQLTTLIDTDAQICTSLLVNNYLQSRFKNWAITAAFGDNLDEVAVKMASDGALTPQQIEQLKNLGCYVNYNSYGSNLVDLHIAPADLYQQLALYHSPFTFIEDNVACYENLASAYHQDMDRAMQTSAEYANDKIAVYILPDTPWSRRVSGVFANTLANQYPQRAHAILTLNPQQGYLVSVRSPLQQKTGADTLCASFAGGGGRKSAAGINHLPIEQLAEFIVLFAKTYP